MDDLIYRAAAITAIQKAYCDTEGGEDKYAVWKNVGLTEAMHIMQDLPPAQRWVPVTEKLPERRQVVIAIGEKGTWDVGMFNGLAFSNLDPSKWNWKKNTIKTVKWWMPKESALPEPPKEEP